MGMAQRDAEATKQAILDADDLGTSLVDLARFQIRALRTPLVERLTDGEGSLNEHFTPQAMEASWLSGDLEAGLLPAGQVAGAIHGLPSVREVIQSVVA